MEIYKNTKVYVLLPTNEATGGSELLHQLVYQLRKIGIDAFLYYYYKDKNPIHTSYKKYNNPLCREINDSPENILIYPEAYWILPILNRYKNIRKIMWWLSVDNFYTFKIFPSKKNFFFYRSINKMMKIFNKDPLFDIFNIMQDKIKEKLYLNLKNDSLVKQSKIHLVQSYYALEHLKKAGFNSEYISYLSDYLNEDFLKTKTNLSDKKDKKIVFFNPKKGYLFTKKIIKNAPPYIKFIPLLNMSREEMIKNIQNAKVYIDFGNHPGKDRLPREAAMLGCCVITGKRGSAAFYEDLPIHDEYKFDDKKENIPKIINKIMECFENYEKKYKDFDYYREVIKQEPQKFIEDIKNIFVKA